MSTITYNAFVSSEVPDASHYEVDTSVVRENFEKTGTLYYYASTSTTVNEVPSHYAFSVDLTGSNPRAMGGSVGPMMNRGHPAFAS